MEMGEDTQSQAMPDNRLLSKTFHAQRRSFHHAVIRDAFIAAPSKEPIAFGDDVGPFSKCAASVFAGHEVIVGWSRGEFWERGVLGGGCSWRFIRDGDRYGPWRPHFIAATIPLRCVVFRRRVILGALGTRAPVLDV